MTVFNKNESPVDNKVLEAKDVQQPNWSAHNAALTGWRSAYGSIDLIYNPDKQTPIDPLEEETHG